MLLWQDFPLQWGYARSIRKQAVRQAARGGRPARPPPVDRRLVRAQRAARARHRSGADDLGRPPFRGQFVAGQELPTWNKTVLDRSVKRAFEKADGTPAGHRPLRRAPPPAAARRHRQPPLLRLVPRRRARPPGVRPIGAADGPLRQRVRRPGGARRPPTSWSPSAGPTSTGPGSAHRHALQKPYFDRHVPPRRLRHASRRGGRPPRRTRPTVVRHHIETLRRLKYRPTGGFAQFAFADGAPAVTWSVLDHERRPKAGYLALQARLRPGDRRRRPPPGRQSPPAHALALDVHVVSDRRARDRTAPRCAPSCVARRQPRSGAGATTCRPTAASAGRDDPVRRARRVRSAHARAHRRRRRTRRPTATRPASPADLTSQSISL